MDELRTRFAKTATPSGSGSPPAPSASTSPRTRAAAAARRAAATARRRSRCTFSPTSPSCATRCDGRRFSEKVLGVKWNGLSILDCLELTVDEALERFAPSRRQEAGARAAAVRRRRPRLPEARPADGDALRRRVAAHQAGRASVARRRPDAVPARRADDGTARPRRRRAARARSAAARSRPHRRRHRAQPRLHPPRRLAGRPRPRRRRRPVVRSCVPAPSTRSPPAARRIPAVRSRLWPAANAAAAEHLARYTAGIERARRRAQCAISQAIGTIITTARTAST